MKLVHTKKQAREELDRARTEGLRVGLVPTMGCFHQGHLSLMRLCRNLCNFTVVSIFVNPGQFDPGEDYETYPRDLQRDLGLAATESVDLVFAPSAEEMYAPDSSTFVEENAVSRGLCGISRPGHFRGVTTVVAKLFLIIQPQVAVFGVKDLQQLAVIRRMVRDLDFPVQILAAPTVREHDGLAMSSRNVYLDRPQRKRAPALYRSLCRGAEEIARAESKLPALLEKIRAEIEKDTQGAVEYLSAVDENMAEVEVAETCRYLAAALHLGATRLIDNVEVTFKG